jgi:C4-dicarboxylate-specific signal transduction histidine kinase
MADVTAPLYWKAGPKRLYAGGVFNRSVAAIAALAFSVFLLVGLGILISVNVAALRSRITWTQHTNDVLLQIATVQQNMARMESNIRAYGLTQDRQHVSEWGNMSKRTQTSLNQLAALVSDNPDQIRRLTALRAKIEDRVGVWSRLVDTGMQNNNATITQDMRNLLARDVVNHPMRAIGIGLTDLRAIEARLLQDRQGQADRQTIWLTYLSFMTVLAAPVLGAIGLILLLREQNRSRNRELQVQLEHSQRLSLMGETASTLAHELKQPLTSANNYLAVLKKGFEKSGAEQELGIAQKTSDQLARANAIIQRLRNFIENRNVERQPENPDALVEDAIALLGMLDMRYRLQTRLEPGLPDIPMDRVQIQQVLVNLMRNAVEAMENSPRKELSLSVKRTEAAMIEFQLRDSGPGLSGKIRERLFEPFNTTKEDGMGVGLSISKRIIQDHAGRIWVEDASGGGTIFCFVLPTHTP